MEDRLAYYISAIRRLRTDSGRSKYSEITLYRAPHKPLLILSVLDLAAQGILSSNLITFGAELGELFSSYWKLVMPPDRTGNLSLPFFHLKNDGFWHLIPHPGKEYALEMIKQIAGMSQLRETVIGGQVDDDLYQLMSLEDTRNALRTVIIEHYFHSSVHTLLTDQSNINVGAFHYSQELLEKTKSQLYSLSQQDEMKSAVRSQGFRRAVVTAYNHRCVLCGIRLLTEDGLTAATAAHIIPWSVSYNDDPQNGLCLCRLCHWVFDVGLIGITPKYHVTLSRQLARAGNLTGYLTLLDGRPIFEPTEMFYNPDIEALRWHRANVFLS